MQSSEQMNELATALCAAQAEMQAAKKESVNPHLRSKYADLASIWEAIRVPLTKNGLSVAQVFEADHGEGEVLVRTVLMHKSGQSISSALRLPIAKRDPQGVGSAITYARRYGLSAIVGATADDDDDAAAAMPGGRPKPAQPPRPDNDPPKTANHPPAQAPNGDMATQPQIKALFGLGKALGLADKNSLLKALNGWLAREIPGRAAITSTSELTKAEASRIIESMKAKAPAQPSQAGQEQTPEPETQPMDEMPW
jgi:hypothetical protein